MPEALSIATLEFSTFPGSNVNILSVALLFRVRAPL